MALFMTLPSHAVDINAKLNQLSKKQDYIITEQAIDKETGELFNWCAVFDGHGSHDCINFIRNIPMQIMTDFIVSEHPIENLAKYINDNLKLQVSSGSTMCLIKIYQNRIVCINCGDSQAAVYKNGKLEFITEEHSFKNEKEKIRLSNNVTYIPSSDIAIIDETTLISCYSEYIEWNEYYTKLACSQSLGHNGVTGCVPDTVVIPITAGDRFKVIIGSDGLWDMVIKENEKDMLQLWGMDADAIMKQTTDRWLQPWNMVDVLNHRDTVRYAQYQPHQCDDIAVVVADIVPIIY
jgi:serine/threonine protein phosphatase PrpC